ncbi:alpha/beta fold hydrolase [Microbacterium sp. GXF7504]
MTIIDEARRRDEALGDIDWRALPEGARLDTVAAPSGLLARLVAGPDDAQRVVLVPGATGSKEDFVLMLPILTAAGYRVEAYDLAGQYESAAAGPERLTPPRPRYDHRLFVDDLVAVLEAGRTPAHVLGYSFAGLVAQQALAERPGLFASLTLLTTPPASGQVFRGVKRIGRLSDAAGPRTAATLMLWGIRNNLNRVGPRRLAFVKSRFALTRRDSVDDIVAAMMDTPDVVDEVAASPIPKLVAASEHDLWPVSQYRAYAARIGAELVVYETGHSPCETAPHQLCRDLLRLFAAA